MDSLIADGADVFLSWLNGQLSSAYAVVDSTPLLAADAARRLQIAVRPLFDREADPAWKRRCQAVAEQLRNAGAGPLSLWVPPGADLPHGDRSDFVRRIATAASALEHGQRGQAEFPVTLTLKKLADEASYVHVTGGLAPHWARLTGRAFGQYELETREIHRLPEPESRISELLEWVVLLGNGMKAGQTSELKAEDAWTIRRPRQGDWTAVIGAAPGSDPSNGTAVRKLLRQGLKSAREEQHEGTPRALVFVGIYQSLAEENATIALRSCDPSLYAGFDVICLVADGACKPLLGPRAGLRTED